MARRTFQDIIAEAKAKGNHRVLTPEETLVDPKKFKEDMRRVREDYIAKSNASWQRLKNVILD